MSENSTEFDNIKRKILDHIENGTTATRPWKLRDQLALHRASASKKEWLEASILLNCYQRWHPARTHGALQRLRGLLTEEGQAKRFDLFMDKITELLKPDFITPHGYNRTFSQMKSQDIFNSMGAAAVPLVAFGCPLFLYAGALLGHRRNGALIGHDDDIDIGVFLGDCPASEVPKLWLSYKKKLADAGLLTDAEIHHHAISFKLKTDLPIDVDLFPAWTENGYFSVYPYALNDLKAEAIFPLETFGQDPIMLPSNPEALLEQSYGKDWRVPDPLFHLNWSQKKEIFHHLSNFDFRL